MGISPVSPCFTRFRWTTGGRGAYINGRYVANATASKGAGRGRGRDPTGAPCAERDKNRTSER